LEDFPKENKEVRSILYMLAPIGEVKEAGGGGRRRGQEEEAGGGGRRTIYINIH